MTEKLKILDLFSGAGMFSLGLERTGGFETVAFCEIEEFPRRVLRKNWPEVKIYEDVRNLTAAKLAADGITANVITGGFPCQDISLAGYLAGMGGSGHRCDAACGAGDGRNRRLTAQEQGGAAPAVCDGPSRYLWPEEAVKFRFEIS